MKKKNILVWIEPSWERW